MIPGGWGWLDVVLSVMCVVVYYMIVGGECLYMEWIVNKWTSFSLL